MEHNVESYGGYKSKVYQYGLKALGRAVESDAYDTYKQPWNNPVIGEATPGGGSQGYYTGKKADSRVPQTPWERPSRQDVNRYLRAGSKEKKQRHIYDYDKENYMSQKDHKIKGYKDLIHAGHKEKYASKGGYKTQYTSGSDNYM